MNNDKIKMTSLSFRKDFMLPEEEKDRQLGFVKWGKKNDYPYFLIDLYNGSAWHQGIIKTKTFESYIFKNSTDKPIGLDKCKVTKEEIEKLTGLNFN